MVVSWVKQSLYGARVERRALITISPSLRWSLLKGGGVGAGGEREQNYIVFQ